MSTSATDRTDSRPFWPTGSTMSTWVTPPVMRPKYEESCTTSPGLIATRPVTAAHAPVTRQPTLSICRTTHDMRLEPAVEDVELVARDPDALGALGDAGLCGGLQPVRAGDGQEGRHLADAGGERLDVAAELLVALP